MANEKVLIAAPVGKGKKYSLAEWLDWIANQGHANYDFAVCIDGDDPALIAEFRQSEIKDIHGQDKKPIIMELEIMQDLGKIQRIVFAREKLRRYASQNDYDYLLFLDTDTIPLHINSIYQMIQAEKDCLSGLYFYKHSKQPIIVDMETKTNVELSKCKWAAEKNLLIQAYGFGLGCCLISRRAFEKCPFDYALFGQDRTDDFGFCKVVRDRGFELWLAPKIICKHLDDPESEMAKTLQGYEN